MSLITVPTSLLPHQLRQYLRKLDELGVVYHFTVSVVEDVPDDFILLELVTDSGDTGVDVRLLPKTWDAQGTLVIGEKTSI